jgi:hypothetical protein
MCRRPERRSAGPQTLLLTVAAVLASTSGCDERRDSAENVGSVEIGGELAVIGRNDTIDGHVLERVVGATTDSGGNLIIADGASGEIRLFSSEGLLLRRFGGLGGGPTEFRMLSRLWRGRGDTLYTYDAVTGRVGLWHPVSGYVRSFQLPRDLNLLGFVGGKPVAARRPPPGELTKGIVRIDSSDVVLLDQEDGGNAIARRLLQSPWRTYVTAETPDGRILGMAHPLMPRAVVATNDSTLYLGYTDSWSVGRYTSTGIADTVRLHLPRRQFSEDLWRVWETDNLSRVPAPQQSAMRRYLRTIPYPDSLPAFDLLHIDEAGRMWLRSFVVRGEQSSEWVISSTSGELIGRVQLPVTSRPMAVDTDYIILHNFPPDSGEQILLRTLGSRKDAKIDRHSQ